MTIMHVLFVGNTSKGKYVSCFVICMQVWVFKHFNYFLLSFPISFFLGYLSILFILSILSFLFISIWSNYFHFYPFSPTSWVCIFYLLFILSIFFTTNPLSIFFYYVYYKLTFCGFCEFWVCVLGVFLFLFLSWLFMWMHCLGWLFVCSAQKMFMGKYSVKSKFNYNFE